MAATAQKTSFSKAPPKEMLHRDYKNTEQDKFKHELKTIQNESVECYCEFEKFFVDILNLWALPFKKKFLRAIYAPCMTKRLRKVIMKKSELKSMYLSIQTQDSIKSYKKKYNFYSRLYKKGRKKYSNSIDFKKYKW